MRKLKLIIGPVALEVQLLDTLTADALLKAAPFESSANTWGDEVYFSTPVQAAEEPDARTVMEAGEIAFWPPGNAIALGSAGHRCPAETRSAWPPPPMSGAKRWAT